MAIQLEEIKKIEFGILKYVSQFCLENNIRYFLCGGTLLGAVRHKGFIPWDDDIDIYMPRPDYDRFIDLMSNSTSNYYVLSSSQHDYYYNFAKVVDGRTSLNEIGYQPIRNLGIYIDIFPLEGMPTNKKDRETQFKKLDELRKRINSFSFTKPQIKNDATICSKRVLASVREKRISFQTFSKVVKWLILYIKHTVTFIHNKNVNMYDLQMKYEKLAKKYDYDDSKYVYASGGAYNYKDIFLKQIFSDGTNLEFEEQQFVAPAEWDTYLRQLYGNYMNLPPFEKRISHHYYEAYYKQEKRSLKK